MASIIFEKMAGQKGHILWALLGVFKKTLDGALGLLQPLIKRSSIEAASISNRKEKDMPSVIEKVERVSRGVGVLDPSSNIIGVWRPQKEDQYSNIERRFAAWIEMVAEQEPLFKEHVYENPELTDSDLRQHRLLLYGALWVGEELALELLLLNEPTKKDVIKKTVALIDQKLDELRKTLHEWHAPIEYQTDIPEDFKQGMRDFEQGNVVDLDTALSKSPDAV